MGNHIKNIARSTIIFFNKAKNFISSSVNKVAEIIVNGAKKVVTFVKKVIKYCYNGVKIIGKLIYYKGKQLINILTNKSGIVHLIEYYKELKKQNIEVIDENNNNIEPEEYFRNLSEKMEEHDQVKIKTEIIKNNSSLEQSQTMCLFAEEDDDDIKSLLGINESDIIVKTGSEDNKTEINDESNSH